MLRPRGSFVVKHWLKVFFISLKINVFILLPFWPTACFFLIFVCICCPRCNWLLSIYPVCLKCMLWWWSSSYFNSITHSQMMCDWTAFKWGSKPKYCLSCVCSVTFCCYHDYAASTAHLKCCCLSVNPSLRLCEFQRLFIIPPFLPETPSRTKFIVWVQKPPSVCTAALIYRRRASVLVSWWPPEGKIDKLVPKGRTVVLTSPASYICKGPIVFLPAIAVGNGKTKCWTWCDRPPVFVILYRLMNSAASNPRWPSGGRGSQKCRFINAKHRDIHINRWRFIWITPVVCGLWVNEPRESLHLNFIRRSARTKSRDEPCSEGRQTAAGRRD